MLKVTHKLSTGDQKSDFANQAELDAHKLSYPEMWEPNCETVTTDESGSVIEKTELEKRRLKREYSLKALDLIATYNEKHEAEPAIQAVFSHQQFLVVTVMLLSGSPKIPKAFFAGLENSPYPTELMDKVNAALDASIGYSNQL